MVARRFRFFFLSLRDRGDASELSLKCEVSSVVMVTRDGGVTRFSRRPESFAAFVDCLVLEIGGF